MTKKFLKEWNCGTVFSRCAVEIQRALDGGVKVDRDGEHVCVCTEEFGRVGVIRPSLGEAVRFAAALNKLRRPLRLIKQDLDDDWAARVKERDNQTCALCGVQGDKQNSTKKGMDVLTAHHWLKTKARAGMARWARACGVTVHFAEHIHTLHENPCWMDLRAIHDYVAAVEAAPFAIEAAEALVNVEPTEARVRALWMERCGKKGAVE